MAYSVQKLPKSNLFHGNLHKICCENGEVVIFASIVTLSSHQQFVPVTGCHDIIHHMQLWRSDSTKLSEDQSESTRSEARSKRCESFHFVIPTDFVCVSPYFCKTKSNILCCLERHGIAATLSGLGNYQRHIISKKIYNHDNEQGAA
jgi:hypothetical protein